jgi:hypothetical protein
MVPRIGTNRVNGSQNQATNETIQNTGMSNNKQASKAIVIIPAKITAVLTIRLIILPK